MTPYMVTQFEALARQSRLHVVFCSQTGSRAMPWDLASGLSFSHDVIGGLVLPGHDGGTDYHLSPRILGAIARSRPDAVVADGYSLPAVYASIYCAASGRPLVIHCEGTSRSERGLGHAQAVARKVLLRPERNGYVYVLDRTTGEVLAADPYIHITASQGVDLNDFR